MNFQESGISVQIGTEGGIQKGIGEFLKPNFQIIDNLYSKKFFYLKQNFTPLLPGTTVPGFSLLGENNHLIYFSSSTNLTNF